MEQYLLDTHALIFWCNKENISDTFISFLDKENEAANLFLSTVSFWEIALLVKKRRIVIEDMQGWQKSLVKNSQIRLMDPDPGEMIDSVFLPDLHKDPFDRLLIAQARNNSFSLVTKDEMIQQYHVKTFWM